MPALSSWSQVGLTELGHSSGFGYSQNGSTTKDYFWIWIWHMSRFNTSSFATNGFPTPVSIPKTVRNHPPPILTTKTLETFTQYWIAMDCCSLCCYETYNIYILYILRIFYINILLYYLLWKGHKQNIMSSNPGTRALPLSLVRFVRRHQGMHPVHGGCSFDQSQPGISGGHSAKKRLRKDDGDFPEKNNLG